MEYREANFALKRFAVRRNVAFYLLLYELKKEMQEGDEI